MGSGGWTGVGAEALSWLVSVATDLDPAGYSVGPMPDKAWVLHPLEERVDGQPIPFVEVQTNEFDEHGEVVFTIPEGPEPPMRALRWADYARRRNIPVRLPGRWPTASGALPGVREDTLVSVPDEGCIEPVTRQALFRVLLEHSTPTTVCTAYSMPFFVTDPRMGASQPPHVIRGPLGAWEQLFTDPDDSVSPNNIWPDDHQWVLQTHTDSWASAVSGPTRLVEDLLACPDLEAVRFPDLV